MIDRFLAPPRGIAAWTADGVRLLGLLGVVAAFVWWAPGDAGIVSLALVALMIPRFAGVRARFDIAFCVTALVAAWSNVLDAYESVAVWDLVVHCIFTGMLAAMAYVVLARAGIVPVPLAEGTRPATPVVLVTVLGLALSAVWEMLEWVGRTLIAPDIFVTYQDTIGDMAAGGIGALIAGCIVARVSLLSDPV